MTTSPQRILFKSYLAPVLDTAYGTALYLTGDGREAEELVQATAVSAFAAFTAARPGNSFKVWFLRLLTEQFLANLGGGSGNPEPGAQSPEPERTALVAAFATLPVPQRAVCALYFMGDFSYAEMAEMTGDAPASTRERLHEGRARLQAFLREPAPRASALPALPLAALGCA